MNILLLIASNRTLEQDSVLARFPTWCHQPWILKNWGTGRQTDSDPQWFVYYFLKFYGLIIEDLALTQHGDEPFDAMRRKYPSLDEAGRAAQNFRNAIDVMDELERSEKILALYSMRRVFRTHPQYVLALCHAIKGHKAP